MKFIELILDTKRPTLVNIEKIERIEPYYEDENRTLVFINDGYFTVNHKYDHVKEMIINNTRL